MKRKNITLEFHIGTIFPEFFEGPLSVGIERIAREKNLVDFKIHNFRDYTPDKHKKVDDRPFGGGPGMVMRPEPFFNLVFSIVGSKNIEEIKRRAEIVLLSPRGKLFNQKVAEDISRSRKGKIILLCGRYEGIDNRVSEYLANMEISIGDYVLSGGEVACLVIIDTIVRLLEGALGHKESKEEESYVRGLLEYPQYTRPEEYAGMKVPDILLSGNHRLIRNWRLRRSILDTVERRPDLIEEDHLTDEELIIYKDIQKRKHLRKYNSQK